MCGVNGIAGTMVGAWARNDWIKNGPGHRSEGRNLDSGNNEWRGFYLVVSCRFIFRTILSKADLKSCVVQVGSFLVFPSLHYSISLSCSERSFSR